MQEMAYPTRRGIAISPQELELPDSRLNLEAPRNWNNHHLSFTRKMFGRQILYFTLRNLESQQTYMPVDIHDALHTEYEPPKMPTPLQALHEIERARHDGEHLQIRQPCKKMGRYAIELISDEVWDKCKASYNTLKRSH